jgi:hypothetical protein
MAHPFGNIDAGQPDLFTQGEWIIEDTNSARLTLVVKSDIPGSNGATVVAAQISGPDRQANAALISAAPTMLKSLRAARETLVASGFVGAGDWGPGDPEVNQIDAAIALATQRVPS